MRACDLLKYAAFGLMTTQAFADAGHGGKFAFGSPGRESEVTRTVNVQAADTMRFDPSKLQIRQGETIKFVVTNSGPDRARIHARRPRNAAGACNHDEKEAAHEARG